MDSVNWSRTNHWEKRLSRNTIFLISWRTFSERVVRATLLLDKCEVGSRKQDMRMVTSAWWMSTWWRWTRTSNWLSKALPPLLLLLLVLLSTQEDSHISVFNRLEAHNQLLGCFSQNPNLSFRGRARHIGITSSSWADWAWSILSTPGYVGSKPAVSAWTLAEWSIETNRNGQESSSALLITLICNSIIPEYFRRSLHATHS